MLASACTRSMAGYYQLEPDAQWLWVHDTGFALIDLLTIMHRTPFGASLILTTNLTAEYNKPATEQVQALADILRLVLQAFVMCNAISLHTCMLS